MKLTIIGDVHGKVHEYKKITDKCKVSICVGDFGVESEWRWHSKSIEGYHFINPGNHDYAPDFDRYMRSLQNWTYFDEYSIFTVRGAKSIDKHLRIEGLDWFPNEELSYQEGLEVFDEYVRVKPKVVISHDCPQSVMEQLFGYPEKSSTRQLLEAMFQEHQPELWVFGHHHKSKVEMINRTRFVCLDELETFEIEI